MPASWAASTSRAQARGPAVGRVRGEGVEPVVAPVAVAREGRDRHQLDRGHAELPQARQPVDRRLEGALGREGPDVELVHHQLARRHGPPGPDRPGQRRQVQHARRAEHPGRLPAREGIRPGRRRRRAPAGSRRRASPARGPRTPPRRPARSGWSPPSRRTATAVRARGPHPEDGRAVGLRERPEGPLPGRPDHSGVSQRTASGGRVSSAEWPSPPQGTASASTAPRFPMLEPP